MSLKCYHKQDWGVKKLRALKCRAKQENIQFNLTLEDLADRPTHCPVLGIELKYDHKGTSVARDVASIDKIIPSLGYTKGNILIVSMKANQMKNDATVDELRKVYEFYSSLFLTTQ